MTIERIWPDKEMPRRAVIVGISEYADSDNIKSLEGAVHDAREMREVLRDQGGFEIEDKHYLVSA